VIYPKSSMKNYVRVFARLNSSIGVYSALKIVLKFAVNIVNGKITCALAKEKSSLLELRILGRPFCICVDDKGLSEELLLYKIHEPFLTLLMSNEITEGSTIVELGANIGYYTTLECSFMHGNGKVIAIEPDKRSLTILKKNVAINQNSNNVEMINVAIGPDRRNGTILINKSYNLTSMNTPSLGSKIGTEIGIDIVPLDDLVLNETKIDLIRMDIEGFEFEVIKGMKAVLEKFKPNLFIELHPIRDTDLMMSFFETLNAFDYQIKWAIPRHLIEGILEAPPELLISTVNLLNNRDLVSPVNIHCTQRVAITEFAKRFCDGDSVYHVIFENVPNTKSGQV
jgi:FkbM family methyltransferase